MNERTPEQSKIDQSGLVERILKAGGEAVRGILIFGSAARGQQPAGDIDLGIVHNGRPFPFSEDELDLFFWSTRRWESGFAMQLELARDAQVLYDPDRIIENRLAELRRHVLPHWQIHLKRI